MSATITALPARPRASTSALPSVRVLPLPSSRPCPIVPGIAADAVSRATGTGTAEAEAPQYIQDALAVDLASDEQLFGPQPTSRGDLPDPEHWAAHLAQAVVEVMAGARPATQILRWTTPEVYAVAARRNAVSARRGLPASRRATVRSVRVCEPADGVAEACAVVIDGGRVRALAMRLVGLDGRWRIEALQIG